ncbi:MAG: hypothetical protein J0I94_00305 [Thiobacillus sp.]|nr:hypothetical protein [Thiobacillus sp.]
MSSEIKKPRPCLVVSSSPLIFDRMPSSINMKSLINIVSGLDHGKYDNPQSRR